MKRWILLALAGLLAVLLLWTSTHGRVIEKLEGDDAPDPTCSGSEYTIDSNKARCMSTTESVCTPGEVEFKPGWCTRVCPEGTLMSPDRQKCSKTETPSCPSGFNYKLKVNSITNQVGMCVPIPAGTPGAAADTTTSGTTAGGTTGGSSDSSPAPNAGGTKGRQVFGPGFTELGAPVARSGDGSTTSKYPELLGGIGDTTSVRGPGGIRGPSQNWLLSQSGSLPSTGSLGSDANSGYLPYSRVPGDQDLIPDPYRLSRNYSTASYSSKTDPVPFLTDFSAFQT